MRAGPYRLKARQAIADLLVAAGGRKLSGRALAHWVEEACPWVAPWPRRVWQQERKRLVGPLRRGRDRPEYAGVLPLRGGIRPIGLGDPPQRHKDTKKKENDSSILLILLCVFVPLWLV